MNVFLTLAAAYKVYIFYWINKKPHNSRNKDVLNMQLLSCLSDKTYLNIMLYTIKHIWYCIYSRLLNFFI